MERVGKLYEELPSTKDEEQALRRKTRREQSEEDERKNRELTLAACQRRLTEVQANWKPEAVAAYMQGYAYGIKCQQDEEKMPRSKWFEKVKIFKTIAIYYVEVENLIRGGATLRDIAQCIAERCDKAPGMKQAEYIANHPPKLKGDTVILSDGEPYVLCGDKDSQRIAARQSAGGRFVKLVEKCVAEAGIQLPRKPGRPRINPPSD